MYILNFIYQTPQKEIIYVLKFYPILIFVIGKDMVYNLNKSLYG